MKKLIIIISVALFFSVEIMAQNDIDALRYSMISFGGTARYNSMAGAFGAVGADFSAISTNPAGLGNYRRNEFTFTPSIYSSATKATYNGVVANDNKYNFNIGNLGMVYAFKTKNNEEEKGWKSVNFGFGLNRNNNFHKRVLIEGNNTQSSLMDLYLNAAQGKTYGDLDPFSTQLAFNTYLLDTLSETNYFSNVPNGDLFQRKYMETKGAMQEMVLALGANYNHKLYIGATLGFPYIKFNEITSYEEIDEKDTSAVFDRFILNEDVETTASGFNFKLGIVYVPLDLEKIKIKMGGAVHTPTFYDMHDEWMKNMVAYYDNGSSFSGDSPNGSFDYKLTTPMKAIGSIAIQIPQLGTISADYEFLDYAESRLRSKTEKYFDENNLIKQKYRKTNNLRIGAEALVGLFSLRCGYALYNSPFKSGLNNAERTSITAGLGIMDKSYFIDFAYVYSKWNEDYYLYNDVNISPAFLKTTSHNFLVTLGFKF